jgi:hypothetical protein
MAWYLASSRRSRLLLQRLKPRKHLSISGEVRMVDVSGSCLHNILTLLRVRRITPEKLYLGIASRVWASTEHLDPLGVR